MSAVMSTWAYWHTSMSRTVCGHCVGYVRSWNAGQSGYLNAVQQARFYSQRAYDSAAAAAAAGFGSAAAAATAAGLMPCDNA